jgi:hypothetical protein
MKRLDAFLGGVRDLAVVELRYVLPSFLKVHRDWHDQQTRERGWPKEDAAITAEVRRRAAIWRQMMLDMSTEYHIVVQVFLPDGDLIRLAYAIGVAAEKYARKLFVVSSDAERYHTFQVSTITDQGVRDVFMFDADALNDPNRHTT